MQAHAGSGQLLPEGGAGNGSGGDLPSDATMGGSGGSIATAGAGGMAGGIVAGGGAGAGIPGIASAGALAPVDRGGDADPASGGSGGGSSDPPAEPQSYSPYRPRPDNNPLLMLSVNLLQTFNNINKVRAASLLLAFFFFYVSPSSFCAQLCDFYLN